MKKFCLFAIMLASGPCFSQVLVGNVDINKKTDVKICEIIGEQKLFSRDIVVTLDYGQERKEKYDAVIMDPVTNKPKRFESMTDALNFLENNGWDYKDALLISSGNGSIYHFFFKRKVVI